jgi:uncharacterized protein YprB with RNaseH-like and TPR domain
MRDELRQRLRELGVVKGVRELVTLSPRRHLAIEDLVPGHFHTTSQGQCFVAEATYPPSHRHGDLSLSTFLDLPADVLGWVAQDGRLASANRRRVCFLDTETTGLSGGTGTMAFVVGLGFFADDGFHVRQHCLRDPGDEPAMVEALAEFVPQFEALVSFNGRAFDLPILENRFIMARMRPMTAGMPHLDLLPPARRLWRFHLSSCALSALEPAVLGVLREQDDVPSGIIPYLYRDYLRTGDAREMKRVLYHNGVDVLSMVTLAVRLGRAFADPWGAGADESNARLSGAEFLALGHWYAAEGRLAEAERAYHTALKAGLTPDLRANVLRTLGATFKQAARWSRACACWQQLALEEKDDVLAHVELAKYFEWHVGDLPLAAGWTRAALAQVEQWLPGLRRDALLTELQHRLARLERKMER